MKAIARVALVLGLSSVVMGAGVDSAPRSSFLKELAIPSNELISAKQWLSHIGEALPGGHSALRLIEQREAGANRQWVVYRYAQEMAGIPVEEAGAVLVVQRGSGRTVLARARMLVAEPDNLSRVQVLALQLPTRLARTTEVASTFTSWSDAVLVVTAHGETGPRVAWKVTGGEFTERDGEGRVFLVDAETGVLLEERSDRHYSGSAIDGTIEAWLTPGVLPDVGYNPPIIAPAKGVHVTTEGGCNGIPLPGARCEDYTDSAGYYGVSAQRGLPMLVVDLAGEWAEIHDLQGQSIGVMEEVAAPSTHDLILNDTPTEYQTSQLNALVEVGKTHDFFSTRQPGFAGLNHPLPVYVNRTENAQGTPVACNAFFRDCAGSPPGCTQALFFHASGAAPFPCVNMAYSTVVSHEYGHFVHWQLGHQASSTPFGEGFADSIAILVHNDPELARDYMGPGTHFRDVALASQQYPCTGETQHTCGQVLAGTWWDIKTGLEAQSGSVGLESARQLFTDWAMITLGADGGQAAGPATAIEVLIVDDDDGDLCNETPNWTAVCAAFANHGIACPVSEDYCQ